MIEHVDPLSDDWLVPFADTSIMDCKMPDCAKRALLKSALIAAGIGIPNIVPFAGAAALIGCPSDLEMAGSKPFFSKAGHKLARRLGVRSPITLLSASVLDPPRTLPAHKWHGRFCREWIDGDEHCERKRSIVCRKRTREEQNLQRPDGVLCLKEIHLEEVIKICEEINSEDDLRFSNDQKCSSKNSGGASFEYHPKLGRWCYRLADQTTFCSPRDSTGKSSIDASAKFLYNEHNTSCIPYSRDNVSRDVSIYPPGH